MVPALIVVAALASACTGTTTTTTGPSETPSLTGTWSGNVAVDAATARMVWTLVQSGTHVTGSALLALPTGTVLLNGAFSGDVSGTTLSYTISIGAGAIPSQPACVGELGGTMDITAGATPTLVGSFAIRNSSCTPPFAGGSLTLVKQ